MTGAQIAVNLPQ